MSGRMSPLSFGITSMPSPTDRVRPRVRELRPGRGRCQRSGGSGNHRFLTTEVPVGHQPDPPHPFGRSMDRGLIGSVRRLHTLQPGGRAMWIEGERLQVIDSALERGRRAEVEQLLADVVRTPAGADAIPSACPTCRRDLIRNPLPGVGLFVSACPDRHGAWMTSDVVETLRRFVDEHATVAAKKRHQLRVLNRLLVILGVAVVTAIVFTYPERVVVSAVETVSSYYDWRVSEAYWPSRGLVYTWWQIPTKASSIDVHDELLYFTRPVTLLDDGITNRLNIDGVLKTRRSPAAYAALYEIYRGRQLD